MLCFSTWLRIRLVLWRGWLSLTLKEAMHPQATPRSVQGERFLREPAILEIFPIGRSSWWRGIQEGRYPAGIKLSPRVTVWRASDIDALIAKIGK